MGCSCAKSVAVAEIGHSREVRYLYAKHVQARQNRLAIQGSSGEMHQAMGPKDVASHYGFPDCTGRGVKVAIIHLGGQIDLTELKTDFAKLGAKMPDVSVVDVGDVAPSQGG